MAKKGFFKMKPRTITKPPQCNWSPLFIQPIQTGDEAGECLGGNASRVATLMLMVDSI